MNRRILYIQYVNPAVYPPLEQSSQILADDGWDVLFMGLKSIGDTQKLHFPSHPHIYVKQFRSMPIGWQQKLNYLCFLVWVLIGTILWHPDWLYVSDLLACPIGLVLSFLPYIKIIYHEHDSPDVKNISAFIRVLLYTRRKLAKRADICILPNEKRAQHFMLTLSLDKMPEVVWNCPRQSEVTVRTKGYSEEGLSLWYHGTVVPQRIPFSLLEAIAELPPQVSLHIVGYSTIGHAKYVSELREKTIQLGISNRVVISDPLPRYLLLKECQKYDVGLSFMPLVSDDLNMRHMVGASNKAFDYLACGMALLVSDMIEWNDFYVETGYGVSCDLQNPQSIIDALNWLLEHPHERQEMGKRGQERIHKEWNYEVQFSPVFERLNS
ncbi:MAG: glycosyltransferase [Anaerolineae bacterium]|nr:glycosyltransferase [Anaerolineae bacterium]